jgi:ABC-type antimicrobial peptide transport system permease subunit
MAVVLTATSVPHPARRRFRGEPPPEGGIWVASGEVVHGTEWLGRPLSRMKRLRYQRPTLGIGLIVALAISTVAGVLGYYGVLVWRFFFD